MYISYPGHYLLTLVIIDKFNNYINTILNNDKQKTSKF